MAPVPPSLPPAPFKTPFDEQPGINLSLPDWFRTWLARQRPSQVWLRWFNKLVALPEPFTTYVPVVTSGSGAFTTVSATGRYRRIGKLVFLETTVTITTNGTAATWVGVSLPFTPLNVAGAGCVLAGRANGVSGKMLQAIANINNPVLAIFNYDGTYPGANGESLVVSGFYEAG
jgi:hypothetical protein